MRKKEMRQRAAHCRLLAIRQSQQPETAKQWIGIAKQWDLLAEGSRFITASRMEEDPRAEGAHAKREAVR